MNAFINDYIWVVEFCVMVFHHYNFSYFRNNLYNKNKNYIPNWSQMVFIKSTDKNVSRSKYFVKIVKLLIFFVIWFSVFYSHISRVSFHPSHTKHSKSLPFSIIVGKKSQTVSQAVCFYLLCTVFIRSPTPINPYYKILLPPHKSQ